MLGVRPTEFRIICRIILAIHLLNQVEFLESATSIENADEVNDDLLLASIACLLGIEADDLDKTFSHSIFSAKGEMINRTNNLSERKAARNALSSGLYTRLFDYVVQTINKLLSYSLRVYGESNLIGIPDIPGFASNVAENSFEQLCINTVNEQLNFYFHQFIFCWEREDQLAEEIHVAVLPEMHSSSSSSEDVLGIILSRPIGILALLDEQTRLPTSNVKTLSEKLQANLDSSPWYKQLTESSQYDSFSIRHFAGDVIYSTGDFIDKNRNFLSPQVITLLRRSSDEIVQLLFSTPFSRTGRLHLNSNPNEKADDVAHSQTRAQQTLAVQFRHSLMDLLCNTLNGSPHFIRCFKPSPTSTSSPSFDNAYVGQQLRHANILQLARIRQEGFSHSMTFAEFLRRYCFLGFSFDECVRATRESCQLLLLRLRMDKYALGRTKVFLRYYHVEFLSKRYECQSRKIIRVQAVVRRWLASLRCKKEKWAVARSLFLMRTFATRWKARTREKKATKDGGGGSVSKAKAAVEIQRHIRGYITRKRVGKVLAARVERAVGDNDVAEIRKVAVELEVEAGLTPDEAARLIQSVFRRLHIQRIKISSNSRSDSNTDEAAAAQGTYECENNLGIMKLTEAIVQEQISEMMQAVHLSNVSAHTNMTKNKIAFNLTDIVKNVVILPKNLTLVDTTTNVDESQTIKFSLSHFYSDTGPMEEWDMPLRMHAKQYLNSPVQRMCESASKVHQELHMSQAAVSASQSKSLLNDFKKIASLSATSVTKSFSAKLSTEQGTVMDHLQAALFKGGKGQKRSEESEPFDFRTILRKTDFAQTGSLRMQKGLRINLPIPIKNDNHVNPTLNGAIEFDVNSEISL